MFNAKLVTVTSIKVDGFAEAKLGVVDTSFETEMEAIAISLL